MTFPPVQSKRLAAHNACQLDSGVLPIKRVRKTDQPTGVDAMGAGKYTPSCFLLYLP